MSLSSHIEKLQFKHKKLDKKLNKERKSFAASEQSINAIKKEKLQLKDKIETLRISLS